MIHIEGKRVQLKGTVPDMLAEATVILADVVGIFIRIEKQRRKLSNQDAEELADDMLEYICERAKKRIQDMNIENLKVYEEESGCETDEVPEL